MAPNGAFFMRCSYLRQPSRFDPNLVKRVRGLTHGVEIDLDADLSEKDK